MGDSVSAGVGDQVPPGVQPGWVSHLAMLLGGPPPTVLAEYGARVRDVHRVQLPQALAVDADIATLLVGGNDMLRLGFDPERRAQDIRRIADAFARRGALVVVVLLHDPALTLPPWLGELAAVLSWRARSLNAELRRQFLGAERILLVDPASLVEAQSVIMWHTDRMHPSPVGHRLLADLVAQRLAEHGYPVVGAMTPTSRPDTSLGRTVSWALRTGVPWFARRSLDLVPELAAVVVTERRLARVPPPP